MNETMKRNSLSETNINNTENKQLNFKDIMRGSIGNPRKIVSLERHLLKIIFMKKKK